MANIKFEYKEAIKILNADALIDGSFKVKIIDNNNNDVAIGYLNGDYKSLSSLGFYKPIYNVLCKKLNDYKLRDDYEYKIKIEPIKLWLIEK